jgi:hypothetical protein
LKGKKIDGHPQHFSKKILKNILWPISINLSKLIEENISEYG